MADSPGSPLSSLASDDLIEGLKMEEREASVDAVPDNGSDQVMMPPSKRQKTKAGGGGRGARAPSWDMRTSSPVNGTQEDDTDISSDSSGDIPASPATLALLPEEDPAYPQVTACKWDGCPAGDLGNMDALVLHIHDDHIGSRQKKYACEWERCPRKGMPHASGYALKAHMRSHTREKPFYCALPGMSVEHSRQRWTWRRLHFISPWHWQDVLLTGDARQNVIDHLPDPTPWPSTCERCTRPKRCGRLTPFRRAIRPKHLTFLD